MQDLEAHREDFQRDGFVHLSGFMSPVEMDEIEKCYEQLVRDVVPKLPRHDAMYEDYERPESLELHISEGACSIALVEGRE